MILAPVYRLLSHIYLGKTRIVIYRKKSWIYINMIALIFVCRKRNSDGISSKKFDSCCLRDFFLATTFLRSQPSPSSSFQMLPALPPPTASSSALTELAGIEAGTVIPLKRVRSRSYEREKGAAKDSQATLAEVELTDEKNNNIIIEESEDTVWVEWEAGDRENPFNWAARKKWRTTCICCLNTTVCSMARASWATGNESLMRDMNCSREMAAFSLSIYAFGFAAAPFVLAPFSEEYGRYAVYCASSTLFVVFMFPIAFAKNITTVLMGRLFCGLVASTGATLVGGTLADLFDNSSRGPAMSLFSFSTFAGTGLGPALMGYVASNLGWRWVQIVQIIMGGTIILALSLFTQETRGSVILSRRAKKLRKLDNDSRYQCRSDATRASLGILIRVSLTRPIYILFTEPIVTALACRQGLAWGVMFLAIEAVGPIFTDVYGFTVGESGLVFLVVL